LTVWWATPVEMQSALARLFRTGTISSLELRQARARQETLRRGWNEIQPSEQLRTLAEALLDRFQLRAADSLQLAAAYRWAMHRPKDRTFIAGDKHLLDAAQSAGFHVIEI
jgi:predicted nucleic acid-binding protein